MEYDKILELQEAIKYYAYYEGAEAGEYWSSLAEMQLDMMSDHFRDALEKELIEVYAFVTNNFEIVETEYTYTEKRKKLVDISRKGLLWRQAVR